MPESIDLHLGNAAPFLVKQLCVPGVVVLTSNADGTIGMCAHGVNHMQINDLLSVGIHINLSQHDEAVARGEAGKLAQDVELKLREERGEVTA